MTNPRHEHIELPIARQLIDTILAAGHTISVNDGEETTLVRSSDCEAILAAMVSTDHDWLYVYDAMPNRIGSIMLIWGNGCDVISDYACPAEKQAELEELMKPAEDLAEVFDHG